MHSFDFHSTPRIVFGPGALGRLGELAREMGGKRALVVSDPGVVAAGHVARGLEALRHAGVEAVLFDGVRENPTTHDIDAGVVAARAAQVDLLVGLGGGSSIDCAKGVNFVYTNGGRIQDYWGVGKASRPMLPMIAVPTTAGTGSECQSFALIADPETHQKMACGDKKAMCRVAILDPETTVSQPRGVTAASGIDAIAHAVESYVTRVRNPISQLFAREAWRLLARNFPLVLQQPDDVEARGAMLLGAALAGLAIENSMLGAAHACANPLTARFGITHGVAVGLMLPAVIRFNAAAVADLYEALARDLDEGGDHSAEALARLMEARRGAAGLPEGLAEQGVPRDALGELAAEAGRQWTAGFNPRAVIEADLLGLYEAAYGGNGEKEDGQRMMKPPRRHRDTEGARR